MISCKVQRKAESCPTHHKPVSPLSPALGISCPGGGSGVGDPTAVCSFVVEQTLLHNPGSEGAKNEPGPGEVSLEDIILMAVSWEFFLAYSKSGMRVILYALCKVPFIHVL